MAGQHVMSSVETQLASEGAILARSARQLLSSRVTAAEARGVTLVGATEEADEEASHEHEAEMAALAAQALVAALRREGDGPYSVPEVEAALISICPLWPFC